MAGFSGSSEEGLQTGDEAAGRVFFGRPPRIKNLISAVRTAPGLLLLMALSRQRLTQVLNQVVHMFQPDRDAK